MPANAKARCGRFPGYNPLNEAETPVPRDAWERRVNKTSLKPKRKSDTFRIPKTVSQEPSTLMPGSPYRTHSTTYAGSRKSNPNQARCTGSISHPYPRQIRPINYSFLSLAISNTNNMSAKKAHLHSLHSTAIPNMDRDIMKTNMLVNNILTEQAELDTQMGAIQAMGGQAAFQEACKTHASLRKAIANRLNDTKKKRARQFEAIRSMRTVMQTLVAEIGDADTTRQDIRQSVYSTMGTTDNIIFINYNIIYCELNICHMCSSMVQTGPNPRSLLRPEINGNNSQSSVLTCSSPPNTTRGTTLLTPPNKPISNRSDPLIYIARSIYWIRAAKNNNILIPSYYIASRFSNAPSLVDMVRAKEVSTSPTFSSDDDNTLARLPPLENMLSPISSPERPADRRQFHSAESEITQAARYCTTHIHLLLIIGRLEIFLLRLSISFSCSSNIAERYKFMLTCPKCSSQTSTLRDSTSITLDKAKLIDYIDIADITNRYGPGGLGKNILIGNHRARLGYSPMTLITRKVAGTGHVISLAIDKFNHTKPLLYNQAVRTIIVNTNLSLLSSHRTSIDILQAATEAAGIDGDSSSSFSVEYDSPSPPPASTPILISTPNRDLINSRDPRKMPKTKNTQRGPSGTTPPKAPRTQGNPARPGGPIATIPTFKLRQQQANTLFFPIATTEDDLLNMSGIQDGDQTLNSSDFNSTLQADASMNSEGPGEGTGGSTPDPEHFEQRQSTPNQETPKSNDHDKESKSESDSGDEDDDDGDGEDGTDDKTQANAICRAILARSGKLCPWQVV